jgi:hypothetical protein
MRILLKIKSYGKQEEAEELLERSYLSPALFATQLFDADC